MKRELRGTRAKGYAATPASDGGRGLKRARRIEETQAIEQRPPAMAGAD